ncbi:iron permease FTR1 family protein 2 (plasmid) [Achromobacter xylosoxidans A8]|uniref:Iron permease FTR1 family protein 2 n=2 Tax=Burkholderiales TaxID=80840 RepID=E3HXW9_ACHXA|nr:MULTISPECIES: cytochrome c/FTR1 family iron permease [Burkholderiales]ADP19923.1 iron permease FTR1 family protein 2 [Achromobacter xylosoxidans A8]AQV99503.1 iron permease [Cupriavidus necator]
MKRLLLILWVGLCFMGSATAQTPPAGADEGPRQLWQLLDYVAVDYGGAVDKGAIVRESEYAEMRDFTANAVTQARGLPAHASKDAVVTAATKLQEAVSSKADGAEVARLAHEAEALLVAAYPIPVAPKALPDLKRGAALFQAQCASCHGTAGAGDGPLAAKLEPPPIAFTDRERARSRSLMALYQVVSQGVTGTAMPSFAALSDEDRWALAFFAGTLSHDAGMRERGEQLWKHDAAARKEFADLAAVTTGTEAAAAGRIGSEAARDLTAFVRSRPEVASAAGNAGGLTLSRTRLGESLAAIRKGDKPAATRLALSAYLDGFEPLEPSLGARNKALLTEVESGMLAYRSAINNGTLAQAEAAAQKLDYLFAEVEKELGGESADPLTTFLGSLTILLREGLEALLIVVGMVAFLKKANRPDVLRYVHGGWIVALAAGGLTWAVATYFVNISGASREVTEGLSSLFAALVLLSVGLWMHQKSAAGRWQAYLKEKLSSAMSKRSAWALFGLSFIAVYREVFETVLFYSALSADGNGNALLGGFGLGVGLLAVLAWVMLRTSARMPIGKFFSISSILVAVLAVVLAGKGVAGLQEAGWLGASPIMAPRIELLGMYPSAETVVAQIIVLLIAVSGFALNAYRGRRLQPA